MSFVEQAIDLGAAMPNGQDQSGIESSQTSFDLTDLQFGELIRLEHHDLPATDSSPRRQVGLGQPSPVTEQPRQTADVAPVHMSRRFIKA